MCRKRLRPYNIVTLRDMVITFRFICVAAALVVASCGQPDVASDRLPNPDRRPAADAAKAATNPRIVFLGDSLTAGYGLAREQSVPSLIQARLNAAGYRYEVVNAGVSGDTSAGGLSRLDWSLAGDVDVLVIELGANDGLRGLPVAEMKRNLEEIITRAKKRDVTVILTGMEAPPNYGPAYTSEFRQVFRDLADDHDVEFVPFYLEGVAGNANLNISDGIHPNPAGARIVEQTIWRALEPVLEKSDR
jgi:acyl-CoA thioesterase I